MKPIWLLLVRKAGMTRGNESIYPRRVTRG
jgi:hypothetical protein